MLNSALYRALKDRFGEVRTANDGETRICVKIGGRSDVRRSGEQYRVCCPYCGDRRFRLYVSYRWNVVGEDGLSGASLAICFNENCDVTRLRDELSAYLSDRPTLHGDPTAPYCPPPPAFPEVSLPGLCVRVSELERGHSALEYLRRRDFCPKELSDSYGVSFCVEVDADEDGFVPGTKWVASYCRNRIVIPVVRLGVLVGWQTRALDDFSRPKYYTMPGFRKAHVLYNGDVCRRYPFGLVVEGVTDVWRAGPSAAAIFGSHPSDVQKTLMYSFWGGSGMCLMLDREIMSDREEAAKMLDWGSFRDGAFPLCPAEEDPGKMRREDIWSSISAEARRLKEAGKLVHS